ncbi:MAG: ABC transporter substrate-binding protein [Candidatus Nitrotoga sp.]
MSIKQKNIFIIVAVIAIIGAVAFFLTGKNKVSDANAPVAFTAILPLTGPLAHLGENEKIGMTLALEDGRANGLGNLSFNYEDSAGKGQTAVTAAQKRLSVNGDRFFIVATTGPVLATLPVFRDLPEDKLVISQTMYPKVNTGYPFSFRLFPSSQQEAELLAKHAIGAGQKKIAALHIQNEWGTESVAIFRKALEAAGGTLTTEESFTFADKDFRTILAKILSTGPDAILIYAYPDNFPAIMKQFAEMGKPLPILANSDFAIGSIVKDIPPEILATTVFPAPRFLNDVANPAIVQFNQRVRSAGHEPNFDIASFYDMTMILQKATAKAKDRSVSGLRDALVTVFPYDGVTGHMELTADRELVVEFALSKWVNGQLQQIK